MVVVEHNMVELDYCTHCSGVWFDAGELDILLISLGINCKVPYLTDSSDVKERALLERRWKCPICNRKMKKQIVHGRPEILIDVCPRDHGLWFDGGEVASLIKQITSEIPLRTNSQQQILNFLGETVRLAIKM
jgi:Zn-finger nucleic acid-binding protein